MKLVKLDDVLELIDGSDIESNYECSKLQEEIKRLPTVDAEPVRHGLWNPKITELGTMVFKCSECQKNSDIHWAYCPYCGAKMDGDSNTHNTDSMR